MAYLLDTSCIVDLLKGRGNWLDVLSTAKKNNIPLLVSIITYAELYHGTVLSGRQKMEETKIDLVFEDLGLQILGIDKKTCQIYSRIKFFLDKKGQKVDSLDLFIGATAIQENAMFLTGDLKHFSRFPNLKIYKN